MDLLKFDKRILNRNVKKGIISVKEKNNYLESLPDLEGEYEIISIPLYDHEQTEEDNQPIPEPLADLESGLAPDEPSSLPSAMDVIPHLEPAVTAPPEVAAPPVVAVPIPVVEPVVAVPIPVVEPEVAATSTPFLREETPVIPIPTPEPAAVPESSSDDSMDASEEINQTLESQEEVADETNKVQSPPTLRPVDSFDDEGDPEGV